MTGLKKIIRILNLRYSFFEFSFPTSLRDLANLLKP